MTVDLDRFENSTVVAALIHYALHVAEPSECVRALEKLAPQRIQPWETLIATARAQYRTTLDRAERNAA